MLTIHELPVDRFERVMPLLGKPPADWATIHSALVGASPARVFVDDPGHPTAALLTRTYEYYAGGATGTALDRFIVDAAPEVGIWADFYGFVAADRTWDLHLSALHPTLERIGRRSFRFDPGNVGLVRGWRNRVPDGIEIVPLTGELAIQADEEMPEMIGAFWSGYVGFAERGFGAVALVDGKPVSINYTIAVGGGEACCGVLTVESHRRMGLATLCSQAFIEMADERGLIATWDCDEANERSGRLAHEIGFTEHAPFAEWAFPGRAKPVGASGVWSASQGEDGVVVWSRA